MKCSACQAEIDANSVYCPRCGVRLDAAQEARPTEPAPAASAAGSSATATEAARGRNREPADQAPEAAAPGAWTEGGYSGKAMRSVFLLAGLVTGLFVVFGVWMKVKGWVESGAWIAAIILIVPAILWCYELAVYLYRTWTIKYSLTSARFFHEEGLFRRVKNVIEVVDIDDLRLERTLWDRLINGGVGTIYIKSTDPSNPELRLHGLDNPERVFEAIDDARRKQRMAMGLKSI